LPFDNQKGDKEMAKKKEGIKIGAHQLSWGTSLTQEMIPSRMEEVRGLGCDAFEVFLSNDSCPCEDINVAAKEADLTTIGCAIIRNGTDGNPLSTDETKREKAEQAIHRHVRWTSAIGSSLLAGPLANVLGKPGAQPPTEEELEAGIRTFGHVAECASMNGVKVAIEPLQWPEMPWPNTVQQVLKFIDLVEELPHVPKGVLGVLFDIYHAIRAEENWFDALRMALASRKPLHIHVAGPDRTPPRIGQHIDWRVIIGELKKAGWKETVTIESFGVECDLPYAVTGPKHRLLPARDVIATGVKTLKEAGL